MQPVLPVWIFCNTERNSCMDKGADALCVQCCLSCWRTAITGADELLDAAARSPRAGLADRGFFPKAGPFTGRNSRWGFVCKLIRRRLPDFFGDPFAFITEVLEDHLFAHTDIFMRAIASRAVSTVVAIKWTQLRHVFPVVSSWSALRRACGPRHFRYVRVLSRSGRSLRHPASTCSGV